VNLSVRVLCTRIINCDVNLFQTCNNFHRAVHFTGLYDTHECSIKIVHASEADSGKKTGHESRY